MTKIKKIIPALIILSFIFCFSLPNKVEAATTGAVDFKAGTTGNFSAGAGTTGNINTSSNTSSSKSSSSSGSCNKPKDIGELFDYARCIINNSIIPFIVGLGVLLFLIGIVQYVSSGDNEEKKEASRSLMIYGIISIFVMVSVWGLVNILSQTIFGSNAVLPTLPPSATTNP